MAQFTYLGMVFSSTADTTVAVQKRIKAASRCYYEKLLKSKLLTRSVKVKIYKTLIRPVLTYGCEAWTLKAEECCRLAIFERKILRRNIWTNEK